MKSMVVVETFVRGSGDEPMMEKGCADIAQLLVHRSDTGWWAEWNVDGLMKPEVWYAGVDWNELIGVVQQRLRYVQEEEGYRAFLPREEFSSGAPQRGIAYQEAQRILCYASLHYRRELYDQLKSWRKQQAIKERKKTFQVISESLLLLLSAYTPHTVEELVQLPGFGEHKRLAYAQDLLLMTREMTRTTTFPLSWVMQQLPETQFVQWQRQRVQQKQQRIEMRRSDRLRVLKAIQEQADLDSHRALLLPRRDMLTLVEELHAEGYDVTALVHKELNKIPTEEQERARRMFAQEGDRYLRPVYNRLIQSIFWQQLDTSAAYEALRLLRIGYRRRPEAMSREFFSGMTAS